MLADCFINVVYTAAAAAGAAGRSGFTLLLDE